MSRSWKRVNMNARKDLMMRLVVLLLCLGVMGFGQANTLTSEEAADGWKLLFDGKSLAGWTPMRAAKWRVADGAIVADAGGSGWLRSNDEFSDFILKIEFRTGVEGNSGIFVRSAIEGQPHLTGYEVQIWDQHPEFPTGGIVTHAAAKKTGHNAGEWNLFEIRVEGSQWVIGLNGEEVLQFNDSKSLKGHFGLQYNEGKKIEFRNIKVKRLGD